MADFVTFEEYIAKFKNLEVSIVTSSGQGKKNSDHISIVFNNLYPAFINFAIIFYSIPLFHKAPPSLRKIENFIFHKNLNI